MLRALILPFGLAILLLYSLAVFFGMAGGRNWNFGYYGEYNQVKQSLARVFPV